MDKKYVVGLMIGIFLVFLLGAATTVDVGGTGTYQAQMSNDGKTIAVMDTRTGLVKVFSIQAGDKVLSFTEDERVLKEKRFLNDFQRVNK
jgi:Ethanolamine utilization protein EutJ (predicted chaperonin)